MTETKLDPKEEQKYKLLRKLGQELHIPIPEAFIELEVTDKDGKVIQRHKQRSHSWTRNAYNQMFSQLAAKNASDGTWEAGKLSVKDTTGAIKSGTKAITIDDGKDLDTVGATCAYLAPAGNDMFGILVGSGTNAESFEDYVLQTQITEGTGAGEISHVAHELHSISYTDTTLKDELVRFFNNNTGGSRAVNEVALVIFAYAGGLSCRWVQSRDHLASTVTIPDTGQLKVTSTSQLAYPS